MEPIRKHDKRNLESMPYGALGIVPVVGCEEMGKEIDYYLTRWRAERQRENRHNPAFNDYQRSSYIVNCDLPRFGTGPLYPCRCGQLQQDLQNVRSAEPYVS